MHHHKDKHFLKLPTKLNQTTATLITHSFNSKPSVKDKKIYYFLHSELVSNGQCTCWRKKKEKAMGNGLRNISLILGYYWDVSVFVYYEIRNFYSKPNSHEKLTKHLWIRVHVTIAAVNVDVEAHYFGEIDESHQHNISMKVTDFFSNNGYNNVTKVSRYSHSRESEHRGLWFLTITIVCG